MEELVLHDLWLRFILGSFSLQGHCLKLSPCLKKNVEQSHTDQFWPAARSLSVCFGGSVSSRSADPFGDTSVSNWGPNYDIQRFHRKAGLVKSPSEAPYASPRSLRFSSGSCSKWDSSNPGQAPPPPASSSRRVRHREAEDGASRGVLFQQGLLLIHREAIQHPETPDCHRPAAPERPPWHHPNVYKHIWQSLGVSGTHEFAASAASADAGDPGPIGRTAVPGEEM